jgi:hypothetical protein
VKLRLPILIALLFSFCLSEANHLIGGEITYTHISSKKYRVNITLYRDCNDGKLDNQGGGTSTSQGSVEIGKRVTDDMCKAMSPCKTMGGKRNRGRSF